MYVKMQLTAIPMMIVITISSVIWLHTSVKLAQQIACPMMIVIIPKIVIWIHIYVKKLCIVMKTGIVITNKYVTWLLTNVMQDQFGATPTMNAWKLNTAMNIHTNVKQFHKDNVMRIITVQEIKSVILNQTNVNIHQPHVPTIQIATGMNIVTIWHTNVI